MRITLYKQCLARVPLDIHVTPKQWDTARRRVRFGVTSFAVFNAAIDKAVARAERIALERPSISAAQLKAELSQPEVSGSTFEEVALSDLELTPPKSHHTRKVRRSTIKRFASWSGPVSPSAITPLMMEEYMAYMAKTVSHNTAAGNLRRLRTIYRRVCKRVRIPPMDILESADAVERYTTPPSQLDHEEVQRLMAYADTHTGWHAKAAHMWLFSFYACGIRWGDLCRFKVSDIRGGRVVNDQTKNERSKNVPLHPYAAKIMELYRKGEYIFAIAGDQEPSDSRIDAANSTANEYLKLAAKACGITKRIHTHNSRHSFASIAFDANVGDRAIQTAMGIGDKAYKHYKGRMRPEAVDDAVAEVFKKMDG